MGRTDTEEVRRRARARFAPEKSVGKAYALWVAGMLVCPGLHRFYLGKNKSASLMLLLALAALGLAATGLSEIYSQYLGMLNPSSAVQGDLEGVVKQAMPWFFAAMGCGISLASWLLLDAIFMPVMVRKSRSL